MTNYEKYKDEIIEILAEQATFDKNHNIMSCNGHVCHKCFYDGKGYACPDRCNSDMKKWLNAEYVEPPVDWTKVDVDTPVLVSDDNKNWFKRYFAEYADGKVWTWLSGATSWSDDGENDTMPWEYAKLAEKE